MPPRRLASAPAGRPLRFRWGAARVEGREGDTVASALLAAGHTVLARSVKYHRPRSYLCGVGKCASCLVTIDGKPSQRACMVPLREGMVVRPQNAWPSPRRDLFGLTDLVFPRGFDPQRSFTRPGFLVPFYYIFVRQMAGLGRAPRGGPPARPGPVAREEARLVVVGGGPAGLAAAREAALAGVEVRLLDEQPSLGGRLAVEDGPLEGPGEFAGLGPAEALRVLARDLARAGAGVETEANVAGIYPERLLAVQTPRRLVEVRAEAVVLATGAPESLPLFVNNDRPGVMAASGAAILLRRHGVLPGQRVVLAGSGPRATRLAQALSAAGARVEAVVGPWDLQAPGLPVVEGRIAGVEGSRHVRAARIATPRGERRVPCDVLVYADPRRPAVELAQQAGCALRDLDGALAVRVSGDLATTAPGVFAAGDLLGPSTLEAALATGARAGLEAARAVGAKVDEGRLAEAERAVRAAGVPG